MYYPLTGTPFSDNDNYCEIAPCTALMPYIRCFWGSRYPVRAEITQSEGIVIPDTCMDIIFDVNYTHNRTGGFFCTVDEHSYKTHGSTDTDLSATFGIRFYAWSAICFSQCDFTGRKNGHFDIGEFFGKIRSELEPMLSELFTIEEKISAAEKILLKYLNINRIDNNFMNAVYYMLRNNGQAKISDICSYTGVSERQLQRISAFNTGVSPKSLSSLIRYQLLWQDMLLNKSFDIMDAVLKYGYTDQSHLLRDFKARHLMTPSEAVQLARNSR
ncbi:MAG: helix-turn-helix transcriptional regulator [Oscillospiraceae bacterium]|nr:helix-turn-helix transcriptional regulator [Oscillospiraceae bacterium]